MLLIHFITYKNSIAEININAVQHIGLDKNTQNNISSFWRIS